MLSSHLHVCAFFSQTNNKFILLMAFEFFDESKMSFFDLTLLGYDKPFQSMKCLQTEDKDAYRKSIQKQSAKEVSGNIQSRDWSTPAISNLNYHNLRRMHVRAEQDSKFNLRQPITDAQKVGNSKTNEPWTKIQRHAHPRSEMTKYKKSFNSISIALSHLDSSMI